MSKVHRLLSPDEHTSYTIKIIELIVFALFVPVAGRIAFPADPIGIHSGFAWLAVLPVIFSARYGVGWGLSCALLACATLLVPAPQYTEIKSILLVLAVGTVVLCLVVGDITTNWRRTSRQAEAENNYLRHRLKEFSNDYHVLKVSHGQLEEYMAGQRLSLRYALQKLKPLLDKGPDGLAAGNELMAVFAQFCSIQIAGLYTMKTDTAIDPEPIATHGDMIDLPIFDQLLNLAIKEKQLTSVKLDSMKSDQHSEGLLAAVPIVDSEDNLHAVLAVNDMHFMAFQQDNLNILSLLGRYVGDMLSRADGFGSSQADRFVSELDTALRYARLNRIESALVCVEVNALPETQSITEKIASNIRSLDSSWVPEGTSSHATVVILLPLINATNSAAYVNRMIGTIESEFGLGKEYWLKRVNTRQIESAHSRADCFKFINESTGIGGLPQSPLDKDDEVQIVA